MTINEVKDALEGAGASITAERAIQHGQQLSLRCGAKVNVFHSGAYVVQGNGWQDIKRALDVAREQLCVSATRGDVRAAASLENVNVPEVKKLLREHRYVIRSERRHRLGAATSLSLSGGAIVVVHDRGALTIQGKNTAVVEALLRSAVRLGEQVRSPRA